MDSLLFAANNLTSIVLSLACWWLAHTYSAVSYPHGKPIAILFSCMGMVTLIITFARNIGADPTWFQVTFKVLLFSVCVLLARRVRINQKARTTRARASVAHRAF